MYDCTVVSRYAYRMGFRLENDKVQHVKELYSSKRSAHNSVLFGAVEHSTYCFTAYSTFNLTLKTESTPPHYSTVSSYCTHFLKNAPIFDEIVAEPPPACASE